MELLQIKLDSQKWPGTLIQVDKFIAGDKTAINETFFNIFQHLPDTHRVSLETFLVDCPPKETLSQIVKYCATITSVIRRHCPDITFKELKEVTKHFAFAADQGILAMFKAYKTNTSFKINDIDIGASRDIYELANLLDLFAFTTSPSTFIPIAATSTGTINISPASVTGLIGNDTGNDAFDVLTQVAATATAIEVVPISDQHLENSDSTQQMEGLVTTNNTQQGNEQPTTHHTTADQHLADNSVDQHNGKRKRQQIERLGQSTCSASSSSSSSAEQPTITNPNTFTLTTAWPSDTQFCRPNMIPSVERILLTIGEFVQLLKDGDGIIDITQAFRSRSRGNRKHKPIHDTEDEQSTNSRTIKWREISAILFVRYYFLFGAILTIAARIAYLDAQFHLVLQHLGFTENQLYERFCTLTELSHDRLTPLLDAVPSLLELLNVKHKTRFSLYPAYTVNKPTGTILDIEDRSSAENFAEHCPDMTIAQYAQEVLRSPSYREAVLGNHPLYQLAHRIKPMRETIAVRPKTATQNRPKKATRSKKPAIKATLQDIFAPSCFTVIALVADDTHTIYVMADDRVNSYENHRNAVCFAVNGTVLIAESEFNLYPLPTVYDPATRIHLPHACDYFRNKGQESDDEEDNHSVDSNLMTAESASASTSTSAGTKRPTIASLCKPKDGADGDGRVLSTFTDVDSNYLLIVESTKAAKALQLYDLRNYMFYGRLHFLRVKNEDVHRVRRIEGQLTIDEHELSRHTDRKNTLFVHLFY